MSALKAWLRHAFAVVFQGRRLEQEAAREDEYGGDDGSGDDAR